MAKWLTSLEQHDASTIYDVAVSVDGYISGPDGDISRFTHKGPVVEDYQARLAGYCVAIMGRHTYEFGYRFGLRPGQTPYPHMKTFVFSQTLDLTLKNEINVVHAPVGPMLQQLRNELHAPLYLCGGGRFAGGASGDGSSRYSSLETSADPPWWWRATLHRSIEFTGFDLPRDQILRQRLPVSGVPCAAAVAVWVASSHGQSISRPKLVLRQHPAQVVLDLVADIRPLQRK